MINECLDMGGDGEAPEFFNQKIVKARKQYRCCECRQIIPQGEVYERTSGKWNAEIMTYKTCKICAKIRKDFFCQYVFEQLWEELEEHEIVNREQRPDLKPREIK